MNRLEIREEAERDVFDAALWYEQERAGLGFRFENKVVTVFGVLHLHRHPNTWKRDR